MRYQKGDRVAIRIDGEVEVVEIISTDPLMAALLIDQGDIEQDVDTSEHDE